MSCTMSVRNLVQDSGETPILKSCQSRSKCCFVSSLVKRIESSDNIGMMQLVICILSIDWSLLQQQRQRNHVHGFLCYWKMIVFIWRQFQVLPVRGCKIFYRQQTWNLNFHTYKNYAKTNQKNGTIIPLVWIIRNCFEDVRLED